MALLQRATRCGRARVRDNGLDKTTGVNSSFCPGKLAFPHTGAVTATSLLFISAPNLYRPDRGHALVGLPYKIPGACACNRIPRC
jgi:hypothetical protein